MKLLIFENMKLEVVGAFDGMRLFYYDGKLDCDYFPRSQDIDLLKDLRKYDLVYVDLDLATGSELDGYSLIERIQEIKEHPPIVIITGQSDVNEQVELRNIEKVEVLMKPFDFDELYKATKLAQKKHRQV